jgi:hypothetical protein
MKDITSRFTLIGTALAASLAASGCTEQAEILDTNSLGKPMILTSIKCGDNDTGRIVISVGDSLDTAYGMRDLHWLRTVAANRLAHTRQVLDLMGQRENDYRAKKRPGGATGVAPMNDRSPEARVVGGFMADPRAISQTAAWGRLDQPRARARARGANLVHALSKRAAGSKAERRRSSSSSVLRERLSMTRGFLGIFHRAPTRVGIQVAQGLSAKKDFGEGHVKLAIVFLQALQGGLGDLSKRWLPVARKARPQEFLEAGQLCHIVRASDSVDEAQIIESLGLNVGSEGVWWNAR